MNTADPAFEPISIYAIRVKGTLPNDWADWFGEMTITYDEKGNTTLVGPVIDQAALHGLLDKVRDFGLLLLSVTRVEQSIDQGDRL